MAGRNISMPSVWKKMEGKNQKIRNEHGLDLGILKRED